MFAILRTFVLACALTCLVQPAFAQAQVNANDDQDITVDGVCKRITNNCTATIMVPTFDSTQFNAIPASFGAAGCATATACTTVTTSYGSISHGNFNGCYVNAAGQALCTGLNDNYNGGTGSGAGTNTLTSVAGSKTWRQVASFGEGACGLATDGQILCWGYNLGTGQNTSSGATTVPTQVFGGGTWIALAKSGGSPHYMCGIKSDETAHCWGVNSTGQLGDGTTTDSYIPTPVAGGYTWQKLSVGAIPNGYSSFWTGDPGVTTCGIRTDGAMMCWGSNGYGQLADGTTTSSSTPVLIPGGYSWKDVGTALGTVCGIRTDGVAMCWGRNDYGQVGDGTTTNRSVPTVVAGGFSYAALSAGGFTVCAIRTNGKVKCWGDYSLGQYYTDGTPGPPYSLMGNRVFKEIYTSSHYSSCGITQSNDLYCWGYCQYASCTGAVVAYSQPTFVSSGF